MPQLILVRDREDGDFDTIAVVQNEYHILRIPALRWILQMKEELEVDEDTTGRQFAILHRDELASVIAGEGAEDITGLCKVVCNKGESCL